MSISNNEKPATILDGVFTNKTGLGVNILSKGAVLIDRVTSSGKTTYEIYAYDGYADAADMRGMLVRRSTFNLTTLYGSSISSNGQTTLDSLRATGNGQNGGSPIVVNLAACGLF